MLPVLTVDFYVFLEVRCITLNLQVVDTSNCVRAQVEWFLIRWTTAAIS